MEPTELIDPRDGSNTINLKTNVSKTAGYIVDEVPYNATDDKGVTISGEVPIPNPSIVFVNQARAGQVVELSGKATYLIDANGSWRRMPMDKLSYKKFKRRRKE